MSDFWPGQLHWDDSGLLKLRMCDPSTNEPLHPDQTPFILNEDWRPPFFKGKEDVLEGWTVQELWGWIRSATELKSTPTLIFLPSVLQDFEDEELIKDVTYYVLNKTHALGASTFKKACEIAYAQPDNLEELEYQFKYMFGVPPTHPDSFYQLASGQGHFPWALDTWFEQFRDIGYQGEPALGSVLYYAWKQDLPLRHLDEMYLNGSISAREAYFPACLIAWLKTKSAEFPGMTVGEMSGLCTQNVQWEYFLE